MRKIIFYHSRHTRIKTYFYYAINRWFQSWCQSFRRHRFDQQLVYTRRNALEQDLFSFLTRATTILHYSDVIIFFWLIERNSLVSDSNKWPEDIVCDFIALWLLDTSDKFYLSRPREREREGSQGFESKVKRKWECRKAQIAFPREPSRAQNLNSA